jgi:hypothetical protein
LVFIIAFLKEAGNPDTLVFLLRVYGWFSIELLSLLNLRRSRRKKIGEDVIALLGKRKISFGDSPFIMRGQLQRDLIKANVNVRMVIAFLGFPGDPFDKGDASQEPLKFVSPKNRLSTFRPVRNGFQVKTDLFGG